MRQPKLYLNMVIPRWADSSHVSFGQITRFAQFECNRISRLNSKYHNLNSCRRRSTIVYRPHLPYGKILFIVNRWIYTSRFTTWCSSVRSALHITIIYIYTNVYKPPITLHAIKWIWCNLKQCTSWCITMAIKNCYVNSFAITDFSHSDYGRTTNPLNKIQV